MALRYLLALLPLTFTLPLAAADWPQFRGPNRDGVSKETGLLKSWPDAGPPLEWTAKGLGPGYSSVSIAGDRIYTLGNKGDKTRIVALDRDSGKIVWAADIGKAGGSLGCTPTVDGDRIYALGQQGDLVCVDKDGKPVWHHNLVKEFGGEFGGWRYCESPLIDGERLIVTPGGKVATMLALNKSTGEVLWKCPIPAKSAQAGYSSVVITNVGGVKHYVQLFNGGLVGVSTDGKVLWQYEKVARNTANVPTPIVFGEFVFSSIGYGRGAGLVKLTASGPDVKAEEVYFQRELTNKHGGVIKVGDYVFGDTDDEGHPFCAEVKTGKVRWKRKNEGSGRDSVSVTAADGRLYLHYQNGWVVLAKADPAKYDEISAFRVPKTNGASWAHPVVCGGRLYLREGDFLYCYDIRAKK